MACKLTGINCNYDRFANNMNTKTSLFNSPTFCMGTSGVNCFNYNWGLDSLNWLFPPPRLVLPAIHHLQSSKGVALLLTPDWKGSTFYPFLTSPHMATFIRQKIILDGKNVFVQGSDKTSYFNEDFDSRVILWHLDFNN